MIIFAGSIRILTILVTSHSTRKFSAGIGMRCQAVDDRAEARCSFHTGGKLRLIQLAWNEIQQERLKKLQTRG
jgi:hypothetical protein